MTDFEAVTFAPVRGVLPQVPETPASPEVFNDPTYQILERVHAGLQQLFQDEVAVEAPQQFSAEEMRSRNQTPLFFEILDRHPEIFSKDIAKPLPEIMQELPAPQPVAQKPTPKRPGLLSRSSVWALAENYAQPADAYQQLPDALPQPQTLKPTASLPQLESQRITMTLMGTIRQKLTTTLQQLLRLKTS